MNNNSDFSDFKIQEYAKIAEAHFKSNESISVFIRYYLIILSLPITIFVYIFVTGGENKKLNEEFFAQTDIVSIFFLVVSLVGLFIMMYVVSLRGDAMLYARTVNGIRRYFYEKSPYSLGEKERYKVLPIDTNFDKPIQFAPVVFIFSTFNGFYFFLFLLLSFNAHPAQELVSSAEFSKLFFQDGAIFREGQIQSFLLIMALSFFVHYALYSLLNKYLKDDYVFMKKRLVMGVDIDGVLNQHREMFCKLAKEKFGTIINPANISIVPVHKDPSISITKSQEEEIFNDPSYWVEMPAMDGAATALSAIANSHNIKIWAFTRRPWPKIKDDDPLAFSAIKRTWIPHIDVAIEKYPELCRLCSCLKMRGDIAGYSKLLTKAWLRDHQFNVNKVVIERSSDIYFDWLSSFRNRYSLSKKNVELRIFVEDDIRNALKLSRACDLVFLINHPYNQKMEAAPGSFIFIGSEESVLPPNIVRVDTWEEIRDCIDSFV